jgi:hypothetical protein
MKGLEVWLKQYSTYLTSMKPILPKNKHKNKIKYTMRTEVMAQMVEHLSKNHKALSSISSAAKNK